MKKRKQIARHSNSDMFISLRDMYDSQIVSVYWYLDKNIAEKLDPLYWEIRNFIYNKMASQTVKDLR